MKKYMKLFLSMSIWCSILTFNILSYTSAPLSLITPKIHNLSTRYKRNIHFSKPSSSSETYVNGSGEYERRVREINDISNAGNNNAGAQERRRVNQQDRSLESSAFQQYENGGYYWNRFNNDKLPNPYRYGDQKYNLNSQKATDSGRDFDYGTPNGSKNVAKARSKLYEDFMDRDLAKRREMDYQNQYNNRNPHEHRSSYLETDRRFINRPIEPSSDSLERDRNQMRNDRYMPPPPPDYPPPPSRDSSFYARRSSYPANPVPLGMHGLEREHNIEDRYRREPRFRGPPPDPYYYDGPPPPPPQYNQHPHYPNTYHQYPVGNRQQPPPPSNYVQQPQSMYQGQGYYPPNQATPIPQGAQQDQTYFVKTHDQIQQVQLQQQQPSFQTSQPQQQTSNFSQQYPLNQYEQQSPQVTSSSTSPYDTVQQGTTPIINTNNNQAPQQHQSSSNLPYQPPNTPSTTVPTRSDTSTTPNASNNNYNGASSSVASIHDPNPPPFTSFTQQSNNNDPNPPPFTQQNADNNQNPPSFTQQSNNPPQFTQQINNPNTSQFTQQQNMNNQSPPPPIFTQQNNPIQNNASPQSQQQQQATTFTYTNTNGAMPQQQTPPYMAQNQANFVHPQLDYNDPAQQQWQEPERPRALSSDERYLRNLEARINAMEQQRPPYDGRYYNY